MKSSVAQNRSVFYTDKCPKRLTSEEELSSTVCITPEKDSVDYTVVAAIDFGTTFSGYTFSFSSAPQDVRINKNWGDNLGFQVSKCSDLLQNVRPS